MAVLYSHSVFCISVCYVAFSACNMFAIFICLQSISNFILGKMDRVEWNGVKGEFSNVRLFLFFFYLSVSCHVQQNAFNMSNAFLLLLCVKLQECKFNLVNWNNLLHATTTETITTTTTTTSTAPRVHWKGSLSPSLSLPFSPYAVHVLTDFRLSIFLLHSILYRISVVHMKWRLGTCQFVAVCGVWQGTAGNLCSISIWLKLHSMYTLYIDILIIFIHFI